MYSKQCPLVYASAVFHNLQFNVDNKFKEASLYRWLCFIQCRSVYDKHGINVSESLKFDIIKLYK